jgi:hypothetical protein
MLSSAVAGHRVRGRTSLDTARHPEELMEVQVWRNWPGRFLQPLRAIPKLAFTCCSISSRLTPFPKPNPFSQPFCAALRF